MRHSDRPRRLARPSILAHGAIGVLATALATIVVVGGLAALLWVVTANALVWFWPSPIWRLELADGTSVTGEIVGRGAAPTVAGADRLLVKVGNRELAGRDHVVVDASGVVARSRPDDLVRIVRTRGGDAIGRLAGAIAPAGAEIDPGDAEALEALLRRTRADQRRLRELERSLTRLRRPLARAEDEVQRVRRRASAMADDSAARIEELERRQAELHAGLDPELATREAAIATLRERLRRGSLSLEVQGTTRSIPLDGVHRLVWSNRIGVAGRILQTASSVVEFLFAEPRQANTEGGIFPALFGTVLLVLLMTVAVMPLGVLAAVYLYEYASEGPLLRLAEQAVNNLAGVPSIVFGMFGLAFFVYGLGGVVDRTLFADDLPEPTFGTGGILWASLTLAVLTIPVVVVATREGLQAVPREWRDGARALGATRWQSLRTIILPAALPGILTGLILAVGRAAGEVAPLMLTGVVKLANGLPVDTNAPYLHLQRKFMHLSFHVYDVSMQSPNIEAAKPMAFASTLVLLVLVVVINLGAIMVRQRVRSAYGVIEE